jgi:hypothetical protein
MEEIAIDPCSSYIIDPCTACKVKFGNDNVNINELNDCVTETAAAFTQFPTNLAVEKGDAMINWSECMREAMAKVGRTPCDFQLNPAPVFAQYPHYFPKMLFDLGNRDKAFEGCVKECKRNNGSVECMMNCQTDYDAVTLIERKSKEKSKEQFLPAFISKKLAENRNREPLKPKKITFDDNVKETYNGPNGSPGAKPSPGPMPVERVKLTTFSDYYRSNPFLFSVSFLIVSLILAVILWGFFEAMTSYDPQMPPRPMMN